MTEENNNANALLKPSPVDSRNPDRLYALNLINRAGIVPSIELIAATALLLPLVEMDVANLLKRYADEVDSFHSTGGAFVLNARDAISNGQHRPELPPVPADANESNVR